MYFVSDVHGAFARLQRLAATGEPIAILGDLANLTDYRTGEGAVADVLGIEFSREAARARAKGDYATMRSLWEDHVGGSAQEVRSEIGDAISKQYESVGDALEGGRGYVIHGNVDRPRQLEACLPDGFRYVHGVSVETESLRFGFVGGGIETPLGAEGEVTDDEMERLLSELGPVDVLCTHVPPDVAALRGDVVTGRQERGSVPIRDYVLSQKPRFHFFGDVHQPQATTWRLGTTKCFNAGYFRATGRFLHLRDAMVQVGRIS